MYPRSEDSSGGCLLASFRSPWTYSSSTRRRSCASVSTRGDAGLLSCTHLQPVGDMVVQPAHMVHAIIEDGHGLRGREGCLQSE